MTWTLDEALPLVREIEQLAPDCGCHVALTGGVLYKDGPRKDLDLLFYRIRQADVIDYQRLKIVLSSIGFYNITEHVWMWKACHGFKRVDILFPELDGREYDTGVRPAFEIPL